MTDYILKDFNPLTLQSTVNKAQELCKEYAISHIPIVEDAKLIGCFSQNDIQSLEDKSQKLSDFMDVFEHFSAHISESVLELLKIFPDNDANIIPVIDNNNYVGYYELNTVLELFSSSPFLTTDGFILVVKKNSKDYSMSEAVQIIESNNAVLLGCFISHKTTDKVELTLKVASQEINEIIQTFRRYNYLIITEHTDDFYLEELKNRADYLQKYLNT